ncbi:MAG: hypothetical protein IPO88_29335 [Nannocystis sp.]|uniref:hypothetical protein n=1 Tax=Nannocystis sp. TaxID=1962667 RepID=UPI0024251BDE|nr:hypothetical protein [Nannocystis sp.]MBK9757535.1 hypothetical protein [Nannocystis sp.]
MQRLPPAAACLAGLLAGLLACGGDAQPESVAFAELCGQAGPVRLLELAPGRQLHSFSVPFRVDDRHYFQTSRGVIDPGGGALATEFEAWSCGPCGESPRLHASDLTWISTQKERWPGVVVGCGATSDALVLLDPAGGPATPFMPGVRCDDDWSEHGVVAVDGDEDDSADQQAAFGALVLYPYPEDPRAAAPPPIVLHPQIRLLPAVSDPAISRGFLLRTRPDEVLALDADDNLLRFDLESGTTTVEAADVLSFRVSLDDGRYLLWQHTAAATLDLKPIESAVILKDRATGTSVALGETALTYSPDAAYHVADGVLPLWLDGDRILRMFRIPELAAQDLPRGNTFEAVLDERRWLISSLRHSTVSVFDSVTGEATILLVHRGEVFDANPTRALFLARDSYQEPPKGPLYHLSFDGSDGRVAAPRATQFARLASATSLVTPVELSRDGRGPLLLVDLDTGEERLIDDPVPAASFRLGAGFGPGHVVYSVDDGPRSGIYVARLPDPD